MPDYSSSPANNDVPLIGSNLDAKEKQVDNRMSLIGTQVITENSIVERGRDNLPLTSVVLNHLGKKQPELSAVGEPIELECEMMTVDKVAGQPGHSNSILEKLFGNALSLDTGDTSVNLKVTIHYLFIFYFLLFYSFPLCIQYQNLLGFHAKG